MKRLSRWVWMSSLALFVGSLPHAVGATFEYNTQQVVKTKDEYCLIILPSLQEMKKTCKGSRKSNSTSRVRFPQGMVRTLRVMDERIQVGLHSR